MVSSPMPPMANPPAQIAPAPSVQGQAFDLSSLLAGLPQQQGGASSVMPNTQAPSQSIASSADLFNPPAATTPSSQAGVDPSMLANLFPQPASNPLAPPNPFGAPTQPVQQAQAFSPYAAYAATAQSAPAMYDPNAGSGGVNAGQMPMSLVNQMAQAPSA